MASTKKLKEEKAEVAADELKEVRQQREIDDHRAAEDGSVKLRYQQQKEEERPGLIGGLFKSVQGTLEHAKEAVVGKGSETADAARDKMGDYDEYTNRKADETKLKAGEYRDITGKTAGEAGHKIEEHEGYAAQKARDATAKAGESKDAAVRRMGEYKDCTAQKAAQMKASAVSKAMETKDATEEKIGEYKDYTADKVKEEGQGKDDMADKAVGGKDATVSAGAARKAINFLTGKKDDAKEKTYEPTEHNKVILQGTEDEARRKMEEIYLKDCEFKEEAERERVIAEAQREAATQRGIAAHGNIFSAIGSVTESIKHKFTQPTDVVDQSRAAREHGGARRTKVEKDMEHTPAGKVASTLRAADKVSGQTFDDPGAIRDDWGNKR